MKTDRNIYERHARGKDTMREDSGYYPGAKQDQKKRERRSERREARRERETLCFTSNNQKACIREMAVQKLTCRTRPACKGYTSIQKGQIQTETETPTHGTTATEKDRKERQKDRRGKTVTESKFSCPSHSSNIQKATAQTNTRSQSKT